MKRITAPMLALGMLAASLPSQGFAFGVADAGIVHDVAGVEATPAGLAVLSSSDTLMFGNMDTGDGWDYTLLVSRVAGDGTVVWTRSGATSRPWSAQRVVAAPGDTAVVLGYDIDGLNVHAYLARFDADGHELWNRPADLGTVVMDLKTDASSIWVLEGYDYDSRITRFSLDGEVLWQQSLRTLTGCAPACETYYPPVALATDDNAGIVVLTSEASTQLPPSTQLTKISPDGTLLWQTPSEDAEAPRLARSASGALAVFSRVHDDTRLRVVVYDRDGAERWRQTIDTSLYTYADDVAFDTSDNVYALKDTVEACTVDAFAADGTARWSHRWDTPEGCSNVATLSVGTAVEPIVVLAGFDSGEAAHGIAPDGTTAFDTPIPGTAGFMSPLRRSADGAMLGLDMYRTGPMNMQL
ncbi:MAG TPA: hypothetical protein VFL30_09510, partial [Rhodanobacteraceae bacterium]|nr:hypothetical protein [Rhodanobacteraceae bacterium]